jgi:hypothetical protein
MGSLPGSPSEPTHPANNLFYRKGTSGGNEDLRRWKYQELINSWALGDIYIHSFLVYMHLEDGRRTFSAA